MIFCSWNQAALMDVCFLCVYQLLEFTVRITPQLHLRRVFWKEIHNPLEIRDGVTSWMTKRNLVPASVRKLCPGSQTLQTKPVQPCNQDYNVIIHMEGAGLKYPHWQFGHFLALILKHGWFVLLRVINNFFLLSFSPFFIRKKAEFPLIPPSCLLCWLSPGFISEVHLQSCAECDGCSVLSSRWE